MASPISKLAVIWMHGLGDRGSSWTEIGRELTISVPTKWEFPDAPTQAVTCNNGMRMTSWFDIDDIPVTKNSRDFPSDIEASVKRVHKMIADLEQKGYNSNEIIVGGFSQGGAMSIQSALRYPKPLAGAICLSGWVMQRQDLPSLAKPEGISTPVFWGHGVSDNVVEFSVQQPGIAALEALGVKVRAKQYPGLSHSSSAKEMSDVQQFINDVVLGKA